MALLGAVMMGRSPAAWLTVDIVPFALMTWPLLLVIGTLRWVIAWTPRLRAWSGVPTPLLTLGILMPIWLGQRPMLVWLVAGAVQVGLALAMAWWCWRRWRTMDQALLLTLTDSPVAAPHG